MAALKYASDYQVSFTLLVEDPNDAIIDWEIESALESLDPLFSQFANISTFAVSSQVPYFSLYSDEIYFVDFKLRVHAI